MTTENEFNDFRMELRDQVCSRCIERRPDCPPCEPRGKRCGIELHVPGLVEMCRTTESMLMETYLDNLHETICKTCANRDTSNCPCPLHYLLQLAVEAVERVELRRVAQSN